MLNNLTITAGQTLEYFEPGNFFRILSSTDPVDLIFYRNGAEVARAESVGDGYAEKFNGEGFDRYRITSATTQALQFVSRLGNEVQYDKAPVGDTNIINTVTVQTEAEAFFQAGITVTNASTTFLSAKADRRFLMVQNNDPSGVVYLNVNGSAATVSGGVRLLPGESIELKQPAPSGAISAIGSIPSNSSVIILEG